MKPHPRINVVHWVKKSEVLLFFTTGKVRIIKLPVKSAQYARIVDHGMGLDPGNGLDMSAPRLHDMRGKTLRSARQKHAR